MIDLPPSNVQVVHEQIVDVRTQNQTELLYRIVETDLSFSNSLAGLCSGSTNMKYPATNTGGPA